MQNFKWLSVFDLKGRFKLTENVPVKDFEIAVQDAFTFDLLVSLPDELLTDIRDVLEVNPIQWNKNKSYVLNDIVNYDGVYYKSLGSNSDSMPPSADWEEMERMTFWTNFVKPYFECAAYYRFILWHGANFTQFGVRQNNEETSNEITDKRKGELMADVSQKRDMLMARMSKRFNDVAGEFDGVTYELDSDDVQSSEGVRIWGLGKKKKGCNDLNNSRWL